MAKLNYMAQHFSQIDNLSIKSAFQSWYFSENTRMESRSQGFQVCDLRCYNLDKNDQKNIISFHNHKSP